MTRFSITIRVKTLTGSSNYKNRIWLAIKGDDMGNNARNISTHTIEVLYARSGNKCAFPSCGQQLFNENNANISNICHIYGLNPGSARYDAQLEAEYLNSVDNLILLCPTHHKFVDAPENADMYSAAYLLNMKKMHEDHILSLIGNQIGFNNDYFEADASKIKRLLYDDYAIETDEKEIERIARDFSKQHQDYKTVMLKILDVLHCTEKYELYREGYPVDMKRVCSELERMPGELAGHIGFLTEQNYIEDSKYTQFSDRSLIEDEYGNLVDISENYYIKICLGEWGLTRKGRILDAVYCEQGYL